MSVPIRRAGVVLAAVAALCLVAAPALAQQTNQETAQDLRPIGNAIQIVRQVTGEIQARFRYLLRRDPVFRDEVIETQPDSASRIIFEDRTELSVGPRARITLDEFVFDPSPSLGKFLLSAFDGVFRFKSGRLAKTAYAIETPTAVIGVRGTTFVTVFGPNGLAAVVLEAGDAVAVDLTASCPNIDAERIVNVRNFAVVVDGCEISEPGPPPAWALEQIAALNALLFELDQQLGNIDIGPDNDSGPDFQDAAIPPDEITIQPASGPPTPLTPAVIATGAVTVTGAVGFTVNDEDSPSNEPSTSDGSASPSTSGSENSSSASSNSSSNAAASSSGGNSASSASSSSSSNAAASSSGGNSASSASSGSSSNAAASSSGGNSASNASSGSSSNAAASSSGGKSASSASSSSSSSASASSSGGKSSSSASSSSSSSASASSSGGRGHRR